MNGFVKIHRRMMMWEWYTDHITKSVFLHLIISANYEDGRFRGHEVKRGQVVTGRKELADKLSLTQQNIRTALDKLKSTSEITIKSTNRFSIITVVNYNTYNDVQPGINHQISQPVNQQSTNSQPTVNQQLTTSKNIRKKERKKDNTPKPPKGDDSDAPKKFRPKELSSEFEWLDDGIWAEWVDHKRKVRASVSERALRKNIADLKNHGTEKANAIIEQSLDNGWKGLFELKSNTGISQTESDRLKASGLRFAEEG
jgi:biotin operon repressor